MLIVWELTNVLEITEFELNLRNSTLFITNRIKIEVFLDIKLVFDWITSWLAILKFKEIDKLLGRLVLFINSLANVNFLHNYQLSLLFEPYLFHLLRSSWNHKKYVPNKQYSMNFMKILKVPRVRSIYSATLLSNNVKCLKKILTLRIITWINKLKKNSNV